MKILIIARGYPTKEDPLNGNFELTQAKALKKNGHEIIYIGLGYRGKEFLKNIINRNWRITQKVDNGIIVFEKKIIIPYGKYSTKVFFHYRKFLLSKIYRKVVRKYGKPDIVHSHYLFLSATSAFFKTKHNLPLVCTEHLSRLNKEQLSSRDLYLGKLAYKHPDLIISVSNTLSKRLLQHFSTKSIVIPNMVEESFFTNNISRSASDCFVFISVGRLVVSKGYDVLINAFGKASFHKDVKLNIIGDGPLKNRLSTLIKSLGLSEQVKLLGLKNSREVNQILSESNAFVLASKAETFGVVFIEALAKGLPVISTLCGGPEEFITDNNGLLVNIDDEEALSNAMENMVINYEKYDKKSISENCKNAFSEETIANKLTYEYKRIIHTQ